MKNSHLFVFILALLLAIGLTATPGAAREISLQGDGVLNIFGYMSQSAQFSLKKDKYDSEEDLQSALMNMFIEADYKPNESLGLYASGMLTMDWIYDIKNNDHTWESRQFDKSRDNLFIDDEAWQLLKEAHVTWSPGNFLFRAGKQVVSWGEMDFLRVMDQINPTDDRRGFADVEFETTVIPVWLMRAEYYPNVAAKGGAVQDLGIQFIFNPNADFIPNQDLVTGNDAGGIWAADYYMAIDDLDPSGFLSSVFGPTTRVGSMVEDLDEPDAWDSDYFEYGVKVNAVVGNHMFSINGFYGRANSSESVITGATMYDWDLTFLGLGIIPLPLYPEPDSDGLYHVNLTSLGYFPRQKFIGATYNYELKWLKSSALGGVAPVLRAEAMHEFDHTFVNQDVEFVKSNYLRTGISLDWKTKIRSLNDKAYFTIMPQFFYDRIMDKKSGWDVGLDEDSYALGLLLETTYLNARLKPSLAWMHDFNGEADLLLPSLTYTRTYQWEYTLEGLFIDAREKMDNIDLFTHKNYIGFKVKYNWS
jgi:hypothetical protein